MIQDIWHNLIASTSVELDYGSNPSLWDVANESWIIWDIQRFQRAV